MFQSPKPYRRSSRAGKEDGFTLLEVLVAIMVLTIGLMSAAYLMATIYTNSNRSRYISLATQLASEELEDLSRWPVKNTGGTSFVDPHVDVPAGYTDCGITGETCVGSINWVAADGSTVVSPLTPGSSPVLKGPISITSTGSTDNVSYFDSVCLNVTGVNSALVGQLSETYEKACTDATSGQAGNYLTVSYSPNGQVPTVSCTTSPVLGMTFLRQWSIEQDEPVVGVRRVTVLVTLMDQTVQPPVTFQMSMVRQ